MFGGDEVGIATAWLLLVEPGYIIVPAKTCMKPDTTAITQRTRNLMLSVLLGGRSLIRPYKA